MITIFQESFGKANTIHHGYFTAYPDFILSRYLITEFYHSKIYKMKTQQDFVPIRDVIKTYMGNNKRTKGEWIFSKYSTDLGIFSTTGTGNDIALVREYGSEEEAKANAEFICEAVNNYDKLKEDNERLLEALELIQNVLEGWNKDGIYTNLIEHSKSVMQKLNSK